MPEKSWLGRAADKATAHVQSAVQHGVAAAGDAAASVTALVTQIEDPPTPLVEAWQVGIGELLADHPRLPGPLGSVVRSLDKLGQVLISPVALGFDCETVAWDKVVEIRFGPLIEVATSTALHHEVDRIARRLPPVPGQWLLRQAIDLLVAVVRAAAGAVPDEAQARIGIPVTIVHGGRFHRREMGVGVFGALILGAHPVASEAVAAIARERGITVTTAPWSRSGLRALAIRQLVGSMYERAGVTTAEVEDMTELDMPELETPLLDAPELQTLALEQPDDVTAHGS
jgi:hypothetical protein